MSDFWLHKFGRNADVDGIEDICDVGSTYVWPTVAFQTEVVGGASDMVNSDGIHSVMIEGLDINGLDITEIATLNAVTPVVLTNSYYRVNRAHAKKSGGVEVNSFDISISHTGSATLARISAQEGQTLQTIYTMPASVNGTVVAWHANAARIANKTDVSASMRLQTRDVGETWRTRDSVEIINGVDMGRNYKLPESLTVKPMTDVRIRVVAVNTDNVAVSAGYEIDGFRKSA